MKKKPIRIDHSNACIESTLSGLVKITVTEGYFNSEGKKWEFYVPKETRSKYGFVPSEIIKSRMLHDFNVELSHYSVTLKS